MSTLANVVHELRMERNQAQRKIEQIDEALKALTGSSGVRGARATHVASGTPGRKRRTLSAEARQRIAAAQLARWAKQKPAQRRK